MVAQDLEPDPTTGRRRLRHGVAGDRMPSLGDPEMRHGRKTPTRPFNGYKRHALKVLGPDVIVDAIVRPANEPEHLTLACPAVAAHGPLAELFLDRGYLASPTVAALHAAGTAIRAKAWTSHNGGRYPKHAFTIDLGQRPRGVPRPADGADSPGRAQRALRRRDLRRLSHAATPAPPAPADAPSRCIRRSRCCKSCAPRCATPPGGPSSASGRPSNTRLARLNHIQGPKARYKGVRKNTLEYRCAAVANLEQVRRLKTAA